MMIEHYIIPIFLSLFAAFTTAMAWYAASKSNDCAQILKEMAKLNTDKARDLVRLEQEILSGKRKDL